MSNNDQINLNKQRKVGRMRKVASFFVNNWIVALILLIFVSQIYVALQVRKLVMSAISAGGNVEQSLDSNINQMKSMMSSIYGRINTMQGDLNYIKSRR